MASVLSRMHGGQPATQTILSEQDDVQALLDVLDDADCRRILEATTDQARTANEVAEVCDISLSTAYRKLDMLTTTGLLEQCTRIRTSGKHSAEYSRLVETVVVTTDDEGGVEIRVSRGNLADSGRADTPRHRSRFD